MRTFIAAIPLAVVAAAAAGCATLAVVEPNIPPSRVQVLPVLRSSVQNNAAGLSIVLRVPQAQGGVSQQGTLAPIYSIIERELALAGFVVQDRGLLEQVLRSGQNLDYGTILQRTGARLILEMESITEQSYSTARYVRVKDRKPGALPEGEFLLNGWRFDCRMIVVDAGAIGGYFTIDVAPTENFFRVSGKKWQNATETGAFGSGHGYGLHLDSAARAFVQRLMAQLRGQAGRGSRLR